MSRDTCMRWSVCGVIPWYFNPHFSMIRRETVWWGMVIAMIRVSPTISKSIPDASTSAFGGVAATPKRAVQLPLHFDLVGTRPVVKVIQADLSNPSPAAFFDGGPGPEP